MPTRLDIPFGQELCDVLHAELGWVCSFMGDAGRIVASSERERIGHAHAIAQRIMQGELEEYSVTPEEASRSASMREGINMAIDLGGERVACFAIAGPLQAVRPLARVVRFCVTSLLQVRQEAAASSAPTDIAPTARGRLAHPSLTDLLSHASQAVAFSLSRLHDAVNHIDQGITLFDNNLQLVVWNRRFLELIGLPDTQVRLGQPLQELVLHYATNTGNSPTELKALMDREVALWCAGQPSTFEYESAEGHVLSIVNRPLPDGSLATTFTDITEKRRADTALRAAFDHAERLVEQRTRTLTDFSNLSSDWFWEQDTEFRFTRFFGNSTEKLRREPSYFLGKRRWDMPIQGITEEQRAEHIACHQRHEPFRHFEYEIDAEDGSTQYFSVSGSPLFDDQDRFTGYHGTGSNITDLRYAELAIRERERQLAQIVDGSPLATFVIDARHRITHWNRACTALTGKDAATMLGHNEVWRAWYPSPQPTLASLLVDQAPDEVLATHYPNFRHSTLIAGALEAEVFLADVAENGRWLHITAAPLRDAQGQLTGAIETVQDVTERRRDQQLLEDRSTALQHANLVMEERVQARTEELSQQLGFMRQLIEAIPSPLFYKDAQLRYLGCNSAFEAFIGKPAAHIIGKSPQGIAPQELADRYLSADRELLGQRGKQIYEEEVLHADGKRRQVIFHKATFTHPDGSVGGLVGVMLDITERTRMESDLRHAATVFDNIAEGVTIAKQDGTVVAVNRAFCTITGYDRAEVIGQNPRMLQSGRHDRKFYAEMWETIKRHGRWQGEVWNRRKSGDIYPQWLSITTVDAPLGQPTHYVATFSDITHQKQNEERIQLLAFSDPLTGLPNRRLLLDRLEHALIVSTRNQRGGALFFIDLDDFKGLNDTRGHYMGDLLLQQVAQRLVGCVRKGDTVARLGGDEFVIMLEGLSQDALQAVKQAEAVGATILLALNEPYLLQGSAHHNTPSIGVTLFGEPQGSVEELLKQADLAMYRAKASGRNTLCFFDPQMQSVLAERVALEKELRIALQRQDFVLHYQPQVNGAGAMVGVEALVRWQHPEHALISPLDFIPLAEDTGLILPLGRWVLETACSQLAAWAQRADRQHLTMAVNVSARQFHHADFVEQVLTVLQETGANPRRLKLELTESLLITNIEEVIAKMSTLKAQGVCFSLDDFGTGYSSLAYLKRLPLDQLKIDQGFVSHVLTDASDADIARMIVALSESLGLEVIAEGVEQAEQRDFLARHGCQTYQGYFFSRPLPIQGLEAYIEACHTAPFALAGEGI
ncbi:MAG: EAL domain-containing protein [Giesbergeria sp.]|nr:EAL domain-containing protein [Giesbergeria sp.]MBP6160272.1 EAL domain-containing protein [Giesbergeria sp.]MBP7084471.1 EAL domain-containing protein [Giesbergeria sp.]MBP9785351.1 EAL domain-containing protein [Giesbergeria sp.]MBP9895519.1 EAL domain-containing protein [Giesbergeria sp.]